jgi:hypothetical protein
MFDCTLEEYLKREETGVVRQERNNAAHLQLLTAQQEETCELLLRQLPERYREAKLFRSRIQGTRYMLKDKRCNDCGGNIGNGPAWVLNKCGAVG